MGDRPGKPRAVIGNIGADADARLRQPPVLHIPFQKLTGRGPKQMRALRNRGDQSHSVLKRHDGR